MPSFKPVMLKHNKGLLQDQKKDQKGREHATAEIEKNALWMKNGM